MRRTISLFRLVLSTAIGLGCVISASSLGAGALGLQQRLIEVYEETADSIVRVKAAFREEREGEERAHVTLRVGTGFFFNPEGHVIVNASRAAGADRVWIEYKGRAFAAEAFGHDRLTNISVLRLLEVPEEFTYIPIDSGLDRPAIGSMVFTVAHSLDFDAAPNFGVVTGWENRLGLQIFPTHYIRSTISVDAGEGGCPLLDINGRLIGVTVASIPDIGSSYALPVAALIRVRDDLVNEGAIQHSWMGFEVGEREGADGELHRVFLSQVLEETPAYQDGLREGDVLVSIDGRMIYGVPDVPSAVFFTRAGQRATVRVLRDGEPMSFIVRTRARPERDATVLLRPPSQDVTSGVMPQDLDMLRERDAVPPADESGE